jgi:hypothetical protein
MDRYSRLAEDYPGPRLGLEQGFSVNFRSLNVYQMAISFLPLAARVADSLPQRYVAMADQLRRASLSIPPNIAEGSGKSTGPGQRVGLALICPITSRIKGYPFEVELPRRMDTEGAILCDQIKSLDWRVRSEKALDPFLRLSCKKLQPPFLGLFRLRLIPNADLRDCDYEQKGNQHCDGPNQKNTSAPDSH